MKLTKNQKNTKAKPSSGFSSRGAVGIDISQDSIKMVQISGRSLNQIQLEKYVVVKLPKNIIKGARIQDYDQLVSYLQHAYTQLHTGNRNIVVAMPLSTTTIETVVYNPKETNMDLEDFAEFELSQFSALDEVNYDFQLMGNSVSPPGKRILLVVSRKDEVEPRLEAFDSANLSPQFLDVDIFAQANAFSYWINQQSPELANEKIAAINISGSEMYALVLQNGEILYKQESPLGGEQLNQLIQRTYQVSEDQAAAMQRSGDRPSDYQAQIADRFNIQVAQEIQRMLQFYYTTQPSDQFASVKHIFLTGAASLQPGLPEAVFSQTNTSTECVHPAIYTSTGNKVDLSELQHTAAELTIAFGLALRGL